MKNPATPVLLVTKAEVMKRKSNEVKEDIKKLDYKKNVKKLSEQLGP